LPSTPTFSDSTVPSNGDVNPYGIAFVPAGFPSGGILRAGDVIVANFNNSGNLQGTGTTIVRVNANADPSLFFEDASKPGFSTALGVLSRGFVLVGNVPSTDGSGVCTQQNVGKGGVLVIDRHGKLVKVLESKRFLDGPWDLTVDDEGAHAQVFVSSVLSGTVTRLDLRVDEDDVTVESATQIASGYVHRCDSGAFVVGPTGLALDRDHEVLYVAAAGDNAIFAIDDATDTRVDRGRGRVVVNDQTHLHGPLGLVRALNGDLVSAQGDAVNPDPNHPSEIVEFTARGRFVAEFSIDSAPGSAFGLALQESGDAFRFAAVDDGLNVLDIWNVQ
jgi:DNA-binding beta-propeller fold protein YncE